MIYWVIEESDEMLANIYHSGIKKITNRSSDLWTALERTLGNTDIITRRQHAVYC